jgi:Cytidylate kinase-like family
LAAPSYGLTPAGRPDGQTPASTSGFPVGFSSISSSGAPEIARQVAKALGVDYVGREIIAEVAARLHRQEQDVVDKEMSPETLLGRIAEVLAVDGRYGLVEGFGGANLPTWEMPLDDVLGDTCEIGWKKV